MKTVTRRIAIALSAALVATTAVTPMASARDWRQQELRQREWQTEPQRRGHDDAAAWIGLGIAALAGAAIVANAAQPPQPVYAQPAPTCTMINGYAACIGPDGAWQYVR
jgi:hypothetical protein